ncbi:hypothetical protein [Actinomadura fibrosa]|uniref:Lipoprotein n=1 Tax=Actinomadura fibrosa TaxID=111802 RepID=A0ABW2XJF2_9ACTN|nr:hypothetical protein [Actinomadura fibrosa]
MAAMRLHRFVLLASSAAVLAACGSGASAAPTRTATPPSATRPAAPSDPARATEPTPRTAVGKGEDFTLAPGQTARVDGGNLAVRFVGVTNDSRCPSSVQCMWEGDAIVTVAVTPSGGRTASHELHASRANGKSVTVAGQVLRLVALAPARTSTDPVPASAYRARLRVDSA